MNKKGMSPIIIAIIALILISGVGGYFIYKNFTKTSGMIGDKSSFKEICPSNSVCLATPILKCNIPSQTDKKVILRCGENGGWFAYDINDDGNLDYLVVGGCVVQGNKRNDIEVINMCPNGQKFEIYNGEDYGYDPPGSCGFKRAKLSPPERNTLIDNKPLNGYEMREVYEGNVYSYQCSKDIKIDGEIEDTITYQSNNPTDDYRDGTYTLQAKQIFEFDGDFIWSVEKTDPYNFLVKLDDNIVVENQEIQIQRATPIKFEFSVSGYINSNIEVRVDFGSTYKGDTLKNDKKKTILTIPNTENIGVSVMRVTAKQDGEVIFDESYNIRITEQLQVRVYSNDITLPDDRPIVVRMETKINNLKTGVDAYDFELSYNNRQEVCDRIFTESLGVYACEVDLKGPGYLSVVGRARHTAISSWIESDAHEINIIKANLVIIPVNLVNDVQPGFYTNKFSIKDSSGSLVDATVSFTLREPGCKLLEDCNLITIPATRESRGIYSFTYDFSGGRWDLIVDAYSPTIGNQQYMTNINILGTIGGDDPTPFSIKPWLILGGVLVVVGGVGIWIFRRMN